MREPEAVIGDNTGSLQNLLSQSGRGLQSAIAREIAWRRANYCWIVNVGHLPTEANKVPDALSRLACGGAFPAAELKDAAEVALAPTIRFWRCEWASFADLQTNQFIPSEVTATATSRALSEKENKHNTARLGNDIIAKSLGSYTRTLTKLWRQTR